MLVVKRRNSFKSARLSASLGVSHFPLYHFTHTRMATCRARFYESTEGSDCGEMLKSASHFHMYYFISVTCQSAAEQTVPTAVSHLHASLAQNTSLEDTRFSLHSAALRVCAACSVVRCAAAGPCMQGQETCERVCVCAI